MLCFFASFDVIRLFKTAVAVDATIREHRFQLFHTHLGIIRIRICFNRYIIYLVSSKVGDNNKPRRTVSDGAKVRVLLTQGFADTQSVFTELRLTHNFILHR